MGTPKKFIVAIGYGNSSRQIKIKNPGICITPGAGIRQYAPDQNDE